MNIHIDKEVFNSVYIPFIEDMKHKVFILYGGAGSGKSFAVAQKVVFRASNEKGIRILVIRKTKTSQKESCFKLICSVLKEWKIYSHCKVNLSDLTITLPNGSEIIFLGADDPERIKSILNPAVLWYEEVSECKDENEFDQLMLRIRSPFYKNQIYLSLNPTSKTSFVYKRWFSPGAIIDDNTYILKTTYKDNKFLTQEYIDSLEQLIRTNNFFYRVYTLGEWTTLDRLVFNNWIVQDFDIAKIGGIHITGLDFGFNDPTAIISAKVLDDEKKIYIYLEKTLHQSTIVEIADLIKQLGLMKSPITCDSAEPRSIVELKKLGITNAHSSIKGPNSVIQGLRKLQQYQIIISPNCPETIEAFENYAWKKNKDGQYIEEPEHDYSHLPDALRYGIQQVKKHIDGDIKKLLSI